MCMEFALHIYTPKSKNAIDSNDLMTFATEPPLSHLSIFKWKNLLYLLVVNTIFVAHIDAPQEI